MNHTISELVNVEVIEGVADVRLNRPEKHNALSAQLMRAIVDTGESLKKDKSIRAIVLSGRGKSFCAGIDTTAFTGGGMDGSSKDGRGFVDKDEDFPNLFQAVGYVWKQIPVPTIAALHGVTFGGGCQLALGADIRIAAPSTRMSVMEIKWGLIPDMSGSQTLRDLVRIDVAKELTFTGRIVEAQECYQLGLVTRLSEQPLEDALQMARSIAQKSPDAISFGKRLLNETWHGSETAGFRMEQELQKKLLLSKNQIEAIKANVEGRSGNFSNRCE
jgi:enoyl-CoA hydratase/carnithine racemase